MEGIAPHKRRTPKPVASPSEALSAAARAGYECAQVPAYRRHPHRGSSKRAKAMTQTVREKARIRQAREDGRPSEDDVAQERLGWRGQKGRPRTAMMTEESKKETSPDLDPGHTS
jgi:hypothetical protein